MIFEKFLKETRRQKGLTQKQLADKAFTTFQNISSYERLRTECSFDIGMSLLNALDVTVIIENNQIFVKEGIDTMENKKVNGNLTEGLSLNTEYVKVYNESNKPKYSADNLSFINFNSNSILEDRDKWIKYNEESNKSEIEKALENLRNNGFDVYLSNQFDTNLWLDEQYENETLLATIVKDDKEIELSTVGYLSVEYFVLEKFIDFISKNHPEEAKFIEKSILYKASRNSYDGKEIFNAFKYNPTKESILNVLDNVVGYEDIIINALKSENFFSTVENGYNPKHLTISDYLNIYDCYSTPYLYYSYVMPNGDKVQHMESFEGHEVSDALNYASSYYEDYEEYLDMYENEPEDLIIY